MCFTPLLAAVVAALVLNVLNFQPCLERTLYLLLCVDGVSEVAALGRVGCSYIAVLTTEGLNLVTILGVDTSKLFPRFVL